MTILIQLYQSFGKCQSSLSSGVGVGLVIIIITRRCLIFDVGNIAKKRCVLCIIIVSQMVWCGMAWGES